MTNQSFTAIVKPTHDCNLACSYCYVSSDAEHGIMDDATLKNAIHKTVREKGSNGLVKFIWHGGEPLLLDMGFFKRVRELQKELGDKYCIENSIQSNGTMLTEDMMQYLSKNGFQIGLSLDGDKDSHNKTRPYLNGKGSFDDVISAVMRAKEIDISGGVITVVTTSNINRLNDLYQFYLDNKIHVKFNPLIFKKSKSCKNDLYVSPRLYAKKILELFDVWFYGNGEIKINPLWEMLGNLISGNTMSCTFSRNCQNNFISIGPLGDVYPCGRFDGDKNYHLGNINENSLKDIDAAKQLVGIKDRPIHSIAECNDCRYKDICNSGCPHDALSMSGNINHKSYYCLSYKLIYTHLEKAIVSELPSEVCASKKIGEFINTEINLNKIENVVLKSVLRSRTSTETTCHFFDSNHTDHHDRYSKYSDHRDHSEHNEQYSCYTAGVLKEKW